MSKDIEQIEHTLEVDEKINLHKKGWIIQRIGWVFIFAFVVMALLGLFGEGVLSNKEIDTKEVTVKYQRFYRYEAEMEVEFTMKAVSDSFTLAFPDKYLKHFKVVRIIPEPKRNFIQAGSSCYVFDANPGFTITFYIVPESPGLVSNTLKVNNTPIHLSHFIYP